MTERLNQEQEEKKINEEWIMNVEKIDDLLMENIPNYNREKAFEMAVHIQQNQMLENIHLSLEELY